MQEGQAAFPCLDSMAYADHLPTTSPSFETRNFVKFHLMSLTNIPPCHTHRCHN